MVCYILTVYFFYGLRLGLGFRLGLLLGLQLGLQLWLQLGGLNRAQVWAEAWVWLGPGLRLGLKPYSG